MKLQSIENVVIVPWDFSEMSLSSLQQTMEMVDDVSKVRVVHVAEYPSAYEYGVVWQTVSEESIVKHVKKSFEEEIAADPRLAGINFTVLFGGPGRQICKFASDLSADMIVMPSHGRSGVSRLLLGSVAERVVRLAPCPVLVLRANPGEDDESESAASETAMT